MELFPFVLLNIVYNMMKINFPIFCDSAGVLLPPPAEAQQWKGDPTEQRGRRWETAQQHQAEAGKQSKTSIKVQNWEQTWDDLTKWSSHCGPKQRSSRWKNRWVNPKARPNDVHNVFSVFTPQQAHSLHYMLHLFNSSDYSTLDPQICLFNRPKRWKMLHTTLFILTYTLVWI